MMYRRRGMGGVIAIALVAGLVCLVSPGAAEKAPYRAAVGSGGVQEVDITAGSYYFDPDYIIVKANLPVRLSVRREAGLVPHTFTIREPEAGIDINESLGTEPRVVTFTPLRPGKYLFYCTKKLPFAKSHRDKGMEGVLEVTE